MNIVSFSGGKDSTAMLLRMLELKMPVDKIVFADTGFEFPELYDYITEGRKRYYKKTTLTNLDIVHEKLRMQVHLAFELGYFRFKDGKEVDKNPEEQERKRYTTITLKVDELGKMIGGWIKVLKAENKWS